MFLLNRLLKASALLVVGAALGGIENSGSCYGVPPELKSDQFKTRGHRLKQRHRSKTRLMSNSGKCDAITVIL